MLPCVKIKKTFSQIEVFQLIIQQYWVHLETVDTLNRLLGWHFPHK